MIKTICDFIIYVLFFILVACGFVTALEAELKQYNICNMELIKFATKKIVRTFCIALFLKLLFKFGSESGNQIIFAIAYFSYQIYWLHEVATKNEQEPDRGIYSFTRYFIIGNMFLKYNLYTVLFIIFTFYVIYFFYCIEEIKKADFVELIVIICEGIVFGLISKLMTEGIYMFLFFLYMQIAMKFVHLQIMAIVSSLINLDGEKQYKSC